jgi:uncharacterized protein (TIGR02594 family)
MKINAHDLVSAKMKETTMMLISRRMLLTGATSVAIASAARAQPAIDWAALANEDTEAPRIPDSLMEFADQPSLNGPISTYQPFGTHPPKPEEELLAKKVLDNAPTNCSPVQVALYFLDVGAGKYDKELRPYVTAWPVRWNPVIVEFFRSTDTTPSGDTTAWCAAFVNYCLMRSAIGRPPIPGAAAPTYSAASASFRNWGTKVADGTKADPGDIVVFRNKNYPSRGHVGFFIAEDDDSVLVLGGNQFEGRPVRHVINRERIKKHGSVLELHSYRTERQLHA